MGAATDTLPGILAIFNNVARMRFSVHTGGREVGAGIIGYPADGGFLSMCYFARLFFSE